MLLLKYAVNALNAISDSVLFLLLFDDITCMHVCSCCQHNAISDMHVLREACIGMPHSSRLLQWDGCMQHGS